MASTPPTYLHISNNINQSGKFEPSEFSDEELIYRRYTVNKNKPKDDYFAEVSIDDKGISVNREKYCKDPNDVLWSNSHMPKDESIAACNYDLKSGMVIYSKYSAIINTTPPNSFKVTLEKTWTKCNVSHCDIMFTPNKAKPTKQEKIDIRLYLASIFREDIDEIKNA